MSGIGGTILALVLIGAVVGAGLAIGAPILAIPIVLVILILWGGARLATKRDRAGIGDEDVRGERIEFDERDRETLTPSARPASE